jgi:malate dehydrogenase
MRPKVSIIGAGNVGATLAMMVAREAWADVLLYDVVEGMPQGKALDIAEARPLWGSPVEASGSNDLKDTANSDIVVITAGLARKPGMSRDDLLHANAKIVGGIAKKIPEYSPNAILIIVTNPMDVMAQLAWKFSGLPSERVIGMGGILDSSRVRTFIAMETGAHPGDVEAIVLGGHGDQMVPVESLLKVGDKPLHEVLPKEKIDAIIERTRHGGAEIVSLLKTGSAYYAPAASAAEMVRAILMDEKIVLPCAALLKGQYGAEGVYAGVPVVLGRGGVEEIVEVALRTEERIAFNNSVHAVRELLSKLKDME